LASTVRRVFSKADAKKAGALSLLVWQLGKEAMRVA
jgi:hypothetical protein